jgi:dihydroorotate dehydrogenase
MRPGLVPSRRRRFRRCGSETQYLEGHYQSVVGDPRLVLEDGVRLISEAKERLSVPVIANLIGHSDHADVWAEVAQTVEAAGADIIEVDLNCHTPDKLAYGREWLRMMGEGSIGTRPELVRSVLETVRGAVKVPLSTKICPSTSDLVGQAQAALDGGSDALSLLNSMSGIPGLDIYHGGASLHPGVETIFPGAISGDAINPFALGHTAIFGVVFEGVPLISGGGVMNWERVIERIMVGASGVGVAALLYRDGADAIRSLLEGVEAYMEQLGYDTLADIPRVEKDRVRRSEVWLHEELRALV